MIDVTMSDEDRKELARLQRVVDRAEERAEAARKERNGLMYQLYNDFRADVHEISDVIGMRRQGVHKIVHGPRTGSRRALNSRRWPRRGESS